MLSIAIRQKDTDSILSRCSLKPLFSLPVFIIGWVTEFIALSVVIFSLTKLAVRQSLFLTIMLGLAGLMTWIFIAEINQAFISDIASDINFLMINIGTITSGVSAADMRTIGFFAYLFLLSEVKLGLVLPTVGFSMLFFAFSCIVLISRLLRPLVQKPLETILVRFYESDKGILTVLSIAIGAVAEIAHKAFTEGPLHH